MKPTKRKDIPDPQSRETCGQVKEAAGEILDDEQLRQQRQQEQKAARVKRVIGQWVSGAKGRRPQRPPRN
jgi:uncharacterized protein YjbJ (UPF0337 family)